MSKDADSENEHAASQISTVVMAAKILERSRADGVPMNELSLDVRGGKIRAVTRQEKKAADESRRKELIKKLRQRSIRGDNSMAEDISRRLARCQEWINYLSCFSEISERDLASIRRSIESRNNRAASLIKEITVLEMAIQRKKEEDPVISNLEKSSKDLFEAIRRNDYDRAAELREYCEDNISVYNFHKKRLKPYLSKAKKARLKFLSEKRQVMRMQFETGRQIVELIAQDLTNGKFRKFEEAALRSITDFVHELRNIFATSRARIEKLSGSLANTALSFIPDIEKEMNEIDASVIIPVQECVERIVSIVDQSLKSIREQTDRDAAAMRDSARRMVFQEKQ
ncbi:MAG: hypothetical protein JXR73_13130 [Candidatus Omnitrophica bacterium]|nr:hypothetical protein [Candidatus Omnitrophota bacterium]